MLPRGREDVRLVGRTVGAVLSGPAYAALALVATAVSLLGIVIAQNMSLFTDVVLFGPVPIEARLEILHYMLPFVSSRTDPITGTRMVVTILLIGVNVAMLACHLNIQGLSVVHRARPAENDRFGELTVFIR